MFVTALFVQALLAGEAVPDASTPPQPPPLERVPRIIHQTWKSETLPPRWVNVSEGCKQMNPD